ncbi:hypothetical protein Ae201684P_009081 [Aphanomyces euteiches]|nr:hypothetical protein Ae201684P_009081 [Aphanomyces euteiches]
MALLAKIDATKEERKQAMAVKQKLQEERAAKKSKTKTQLTRQTNGAAAKTTERQEQAQTSAQASETDEKNSQAGRNGGTNNPWHLVGCNPSDID